MKSNPKFTFIIPAYNCENTITKTVYSIINQNIESIEIIIINDGSTDSTAKILGNIAKNYDYIHIITTSNKGVSNARNIGIGAAKGEYVLFIDADDQIEECFYKNIISKINDEDIIFYGYKTLSDTQKIKKYSFPTSKLKNEEINKFFIENINFGVYCMSCWNKIYKKDKIKSIKFDTNLSNGEDFLFNIEYLTQGLSSSLVISSIGYNYNIIDNCYKYRKNSIDNHIFITERLLFLTQNMDIDNIYSINHYFWNAIIYDLLAISMTKKLSIANKIKEFKKVNYCDLIKILKFPNSLGKKKRIISKIIKFNYIISFLIIKFYSFKINWR